MSKVKVEIKFGSQALFYDIRVDGKTVCTTPAHTSPIALKQLFQKVFDAMDIENVEVVIE